MKGGDMEERVIRFPELGTEEAGEYGISENGLIRQGSKAAITYAIVLWWMKTNGLSGPEGLESLENAGALDELEASGIAKSLARIVSSIAAYNLSYTQESRRSLPQIEEGMRDV